MEVEKTKSKKYNLYYQGQRLNRRQMTKKELHHMLLSSGYTGEGVLDKIKHIGRVVRNVFTNDVSFQTETAIEKWGNYNIVEASIYRIPVDIKYIVDLISLGKFSENVKKSYDEVWHLLAILKLVDPDTGKEVYVKTEKVPNIRWEQLDSYERSYKDSEKYVWKLQRSAKLAVVIATAQQSLGKDFVRYTASRHNCQEYLLTLCYAMSVAGVTKLPKQLFEFIYQDPIKLFMGIEQTAKISDFVTGVGHTIGRILGKGSL